jgi:hypothetical protein
MKKLTTDNISKYYLQIIALKKRVCFSCDKDIADNLPSYNLQYMATKQESRHFIGFCVTCFLEIAGDEFNLRLVDPI